MGKGVHDLGLVQRAAMRTAGWLLTVTGAPKVGAFASGRTTRRDPDWKPQGRGANAEAELTGEGRDELVKRHRDLVDNNESIDGAIQTITENVIGPDGIGFEAATGFPDLDASIEAYLEKAMGRVDPSRTMSLAEHQTLFLRELLAGDVGVHFVMADAIGKHPKGWAIELVPGERIATNCTGQDPSTKNTVRQGVEYDKQGRVVAYHVLTMHPRDGGLLGGTNAAGAFGFALGAQILGLAPGSPGLVRLGTENFTLVYRKRRAEQLRGLPATLSCAGTVRDEESFAQAALDQAKLAAVMGTFFELPGALSATVFQGAAGEPLAVDAMGKPYSRTESATMGFVPQGSKMHVMQSQQPGPAIEGVVRTLWRKVSRCLRIAYAPITGDTSQGNFSSDRADNLRERKYYKTDQRVVWEHDTDPLRMRCIDLGMMTGEIRLTAEHQKAMAANPRMVYGVSIKWPGWEYVNPSQEAAAVNMDIGGGYRSAIEVISQRGGDWRQVIRERVAFAALLRDEMEAKQVTAEHLALATNAAIAAVQIAVSENQSENQNGGGGNGGGKNDAADVLAFKKRARA